MYNITGSFQKRWVSSFTGSDTQQSNHPLKVRKLMHSERGVNSELISPSALVFQVDAFPCKVPLASEGYPPPTPAVPWEHSLVLVRVPALDLPH